ncbi:MAG: response regulator [Geobacter sp.]|nr:response regulator [Geobacter sp.]
MGIRLLLADDSITIQKVVGIIFANEDYDLTVVDNGVAALEKAREIVPDVMLVDALMPGRNGYEVCQEIRAESRLQHVPLLLMTGAFEPFDETRAQQCGADDFISKPFESQQLVEKVTKLVELGRQRAKAQVPPPAEPAAPIAEPAPIFVPPVAEPWEFAAPEPPLSFEPIPEMFDDTLLASEAEIMPAFQAAPAPPEDFAVEVVEAAPEDDPWGVFDLTDLDEEPAALPVAEVESAPALPEEPAGFAFADEEPEPEQPAEEPSFASQGFDAKWEPVEEEMYQFQDEEPTPAGETFTVGMGEPLANLAEEPARFAEPDVFAEPVPEEPVPVTASCIEPATVDEPAAAAAPFGEAQLRMILSQLSREVIEKVVWEVVPDLAETLIKEEIRKLKERVAQ